MNSSPSILRIGFLCILALLCFPSFAQITLNPCIQNKPVTIVVLGSSTAAGTGVSTPDSAWVNRYRKSLEQINPANQVINLAVGGYTTYRIMPDSFAAPSSRPLVSFNNNIDKAFSYNPDAIIVNLPSNDRSWPKTEQLDNFDSLVNYSNSHNIPLYLFTTQPIQTASFSQYQKDVADSILLRHPSYSIDVFYPLADTNYVVKALYAADAVHLNDKGHNLIHSIVLQKDILQQIYQPSIGVDLGILEILSLTSSCTDSNAQISVVVNNFGDSLSPGAWVNLNVNGINYSLSSSKGIANCVIDTLQQIVNLSQSGQYNIQASIALTNDINPDNDSSSISFKLIQRPSLLATTDTLCFGQSTDFSTQLISGDTILYYANSLDTLPLSSISSFSLLADTMIYAQAVAGDLYYKDQIFTQDNGSTNFNGNMFNLFAKKDTYLDSISILPQQLGANPIKVYTKMGSYTSYEQSPSAWTLIINDTLRVTTIGDFYAIDMNAMKLNANDTIGIYIQMANSAHNLNYQSGTVARVISTPELDYISGAGISYNFGTPYTPRYISAHFYYHHGANYLGQCHSERTKLSRAISQEDLDLGPIQNFTLEGDTVYCPKGYTNHLWVNSSKGDTISQSDWVFIDSTQLIGNSSAVQLICTALDKWGCFQTDSILIKLNGHINTPDYLIQRIELYPNPANQSFRLQLPSTDSGQWSIQMFDLQARKLKDQNIDAAARLTIENLLEGIYILKIYKDSVFVGTKKLIVEH